MFDFFFLLLFLFGIAALLQMDWVTYLLYVVGGVWLFSQWWTRRSLEHLQVERRMDSRGFTGDEVLTTVVLRNPGRLPIPWVRLQESLPVELKSIASYSAVTTIGGRSQIEHTFPLYCQRRGYFEVGPLRLYAGDLFGFSQNSRQEPQPASFIVYPRVLSLQQLGLPSWLPFGTLRSRHRIFEDPTRISGVRPYDRNDGMRRIHWRASARENELLVKKYQPGIALSTTLVLDLLAPAYPLRERYSATEWAITVAASLVSHLCADQQQAVGLLCSGWDPLSGAAARPIPSHSGRAHLMTMLDLLARIQVAEPEQAADTVHEQKLSDWLPKHTADLNWGSTLLVVTARATDDLLWALHHLYRRGLRIVLVTCVATTSFPQQQSRAASLGIQAVQTIWESDLAQLQQAKSS